ncbi:MAG: hypothetical protein H0U76_06915 [Ktedonobacteraceae bacterium]|nr:hypothetical protein [Ktedonobacteraceae bacterium]
MEAKSIEYVLSGKVLQDNFTDHAAALLWSVSLTQIGGTDGREAFVKSQ